MRHTNPRSLDHLVEFPLEEQRLATQMAVANHNRFEGAYLAMKEEFPAFAEFLNFIIEDSGVCEERLVWYRVFAAIEKERLDGSARTVRAIADMPSLRDRAPRRFEGGGKACTFYLAQLAELVRSA